MRKILTELLVCVVVFTMVSAGSLTYAEPPFGNGPTGSGSTTADNSPGSEDGERGKHRRGKSGFESIIRELNLTSEQEKLIQEHREDHRYKMKQISQVLKIKRMEMRYELEKLDIDKEKISTLVMEIKPLLGKQVELRVESIYAMMEVLTPEQFKKLQKGINKKTSRGRQRKKSRSRKPSGKQFQ